LGVKLDVKPAYTELHHTVYMDLSEMDDADAVEVPGGMGKSRWFTPARLTIKYRWRTQLGDTGWHIDGFEVSGPWRQPDDDGRPAGSGMVLWYWGIAPSWAQQLAVEHMPTKIGLAPNLADRPFGDDSCDRCASLLGDGTDDVPVQTKRGVFCGSDCAEREESAAEEFGP
jgi:hypothetical protein